MQKFKPNDTAQERDKDMGLLDGLEKLINEHGSAAILRERISLANDKFAALEEKVEELKAENEKLMAENLDLRQKNKTLESKLPNQNTNPNGYYCDHCGSQSLKRTGNRPDPTFGDLGIKQAIFSCNECGKESGFTQDP